MNETDVPIPPSPEGASPQPPAVRRDRPTRQYLIVSAIALGNVILALLFFLAGFYVRGLMDQPRALPTVPEPPAAGEVRVPGVSADDDPARGPAGAAVTIVEFSDFQCPFCQRFSRETLPLILKNYGDRVRFVYRDFPLAQLHPGAQPAAEAAQCAFEQGRFWEYHDLLFQDPGALNAATFRAYARTLGLDAAAFDRCVEARRFAGEVQRDFAAGRSYGVNATPTFFVNGLMVVGAQPFDAFQQVIEQELARATRR